MTKKILLLVILFTVFGSGLVLALEEGAIITDIDLISMEGEKISFGSFFKEEGNYILVDVWATWCQPCILAMNDYQKNLEFFRNHDIEIVAISAGDSLNAVRNFIEKYSISFPVFMDTNMKSLSAWGIKGIPTVFLVDKDGEIIMKSIGYRNFNHFKMLINNALAKSAAKDH